MPQNNLEIILSLDDRVSSGLKKVGDNLDSLSKTINRVGRDFTQIGQTISLFGGAILGPLVLAVNESSKRIKGLGDAMSNIKNTVTNLQIEVGRALTPMIQQLSFAIQELYKWFISLPNSVRDTAIQTAALVGAFSLALGIVFTLSGKLIQLASNIFAVSGAFLKLAAVNPVVIGLVAGFGLLYLMGFKLRDIAHIILTAFEVTFGFLKNGLLTIKVFFSSLLATMIDGLALYVGHLAGIPGPTQQAMAELTNSLIVASGDLKVATTKDLIEIEKTANKTFETIKTGSGDWAVAFDGMAENVDGLLKKMNTLDVTTLKTVTVTARAFKNVADGMKQAGQTLQQSLQQAAAVNKKYAKAAKAISLALAIIDTAQSITRAYKDYPYPINIAIAGIMAAAGAIQVATISSQKFHKGGVVGGAGEEVPATLLRGEGVVSRRGMAKIGAEGLNRINNAIGEGLSSINIYIANAQMSSSLGIERTAEELGFAVERNLKSSRGI